MYKNDALDQYAGESGNTRITKLKISIMKQRIYKNDNSNEQDRVRCEEARSQKATE